MRPSAALARFLLLSAGRRADGPTPRRRPRVPLGAARQVGASISAPALLAVFRMVGAGANIVDR